MEASPSPNQIKKTVTRTPVKTTTLDVDVDLMTCNSSLMQQSTTKLSQEKELDWTSIAENQDRQSNCTDHSSRLAISDMVHNVDNNDGLSTNKNNTRSAASSKSEINDVPLADVLRNAGWSNARTFATRYDKAVVEDVNLLNILTSR